MSQVIATPVAIISNISKAINLLVNALVMLLAIVAARGGSGQPLSAGEALGEPEVHHCIML